MADQTMRTLSTGAAITASDLFLTRQGADTADKTVTGTQLSNFVNSLLPAAPVTSVNGATGAVSLDTDDIAEGATNLYFTDGRAQTACVEDAINNGVTDVAPSQNAVFDAVATASKRVIQIKVVADDTIVTTGASKVVICIPTALNNYVLTEAAAFVSTQSSSGDVTVQIVNISNANTDMLSTVISVDALTDTSYDAGTPPVIDTNEDTVLTGDLIGIDVDTAGTGAQGLGIMLTFSAP